MVQVDSNSHLRSKQSSSGFPGHQRRPKTASEPQNSLLALQWAPTRRLRAQNQSQLRQVAHTRSRFAASRGVPPRSLHATLTVHLPERLRRMQDIHSQAQPRRVHRGTPRRNPLHSRAPNKRLRGASATGRRRPVCGKPQAGGQVGIFRPLGTLQQTSR